MRKKKLVLTKETVKNLTLDSEELGGVVGGAGTEVMYTTGSTNACPNTGSTCHSCGSSCLACPTSGQFTPVINPTYFGGH